MSRRPKRVLHVMNGAGGGAALSTLGLIAGLAKRGVASAIVCHDMGDEAEKARVAEAVGGAVVFTPLYWWNKKLRTARWKRPLAELRQTLRTGAGMGSAAQVAAFALREGCDVVHTNTVLTPEGARAASLLGRPHVWHIREMLGPGAPFQLGASGQALGDLLARRASMIVCNSAATARPLVPFLPPEQLAVVDNGIDLSRFTPRAAPRPPGAPAVVGMIGNLTSRWKKHDLFLEAAARVQAPGPIEFRFYGHADGQDPYVVELKARADKLGLGDRVRWMGHVSPPEIMAELDVLLHPADQESFGRIIVEAMAAAVPVVGVAAGGVGEIVVSGETGLLAPPDDAAGLAACVSRYLNDPAYAKQLGDAGRARAQARYSIEAHVEAMLDVYDRAMARPLGLLPRKDHRA